MCGDAMPNMTLSLPEDVHRIVKAHSEVRWSEIARRAIEEYAKKIALLDTLTQHSAIAEEDIMALDAKVKEGIQKHYRQKALKKTRR